MNATQLLGDLEELSPKLIKEIQNQSLKQWVNESQALAKIIYENTPSNSKLGEEYQSRYLPLLKIQLQRGGLRLAAQLNEIFK
jgi:hypothetical protein